MDIARQVKGETGSTEPLEVLQTEIQEMMDMWKSTTYPQAWQYMMQCGEAVTTMGYMRNPWGRLRRFPKTHKTDILAAMKREAQNFPIQSTVSDTCMIAMYNMVEYRKRTGLHFRIVNQIHDAVMVEAPISEIEATKEMFHDTMGTIKIPMEFGDPLQLGIDIEVLDRWGVERKETKNTVKT